MGDGMDLGRVGDEFDQDMLYEILKELVKTVPY